jgi:hypothetical protein
MIKIEATTTVQELSRAMRSLSDKQLPFALALAATRTAKRVEKGVQGVMRQRIDNPTQYTLNSLFVKAATKANTGAVVGFKDKGQGVVPGTYMQTPVHGGRRKPKRFEKALQAKGLLKNGQAALPLPALQDANGNVKGNVARRILAGLDSPKSKYFVADIDGMNGIWERRKTSFGEGIRPLFAFVDYLPTYRTQIPFFAIAESIVEANYQREFVSALDYAIETARR